MNHNAPQQLFFNTLPNELIALDLDPDNEYGAWAGFIGNRPVLRILNRGLFQAFLDPNHRLQQNYALLGPASVGKTTLAKRIADILKIPFIEIHPQSVKSVEDILAVISTVLAEWGLPLIPDNMIFQVPPCIIFIDEIHLLKSTIVQGLLKATERNDARVVSKKGYEFNFSRCAWIVATTDIGLLFDAFVTRFVHLNLTLYSNYEMAQIVQSKNKDWSIKECGLVAKYAGTIPREALAFADEMRQQYLMQPDRWENIAKIIAEDHGIDEFGMTKQRLAILVALGQQGPISMNRMTAVVRVKEEELQKFVMPPLLLSTPDRDPLVTVASGKGFCITQAGLDELNKRKIKNIGIYAMPDSVKPKINFRGSADLN